jgi:hypothetical protein
MSIRTLLAVAAMLVCSVAHAGLLGETIELQRLGPDISTPLGDTANGNYVVGAGVEVTGAFQNNVQLDISDDQLLFSFSNLSVASRPFVGLRLSDVLGQIDAFTAFTVSTESSIEFASSRLSFDADNLWVNFAGLSFAQGDRLVLNVVDSSPAPVPAVPEPATKVLMLLGLGSLLALRARSHLGGALARPRVAEIYFVQPSHRR